MPATLRPHPLLALGFALVLAGCEGQATPVARVERPVQVQRVAFAREDTSHGFVGIVRARYETDLGFRVAGKIVARVVNVGDRVHAGDIVAGSIPATSSCRW